MIVKNKFKVNLQIKRPIIKFIYSVYSFYKLQKIIHDKIILIIIIFFFATENLHEVCNRPLVHSHCLDNPRFLREGQIHIVNVATDGPHCSHMHHGAASQTQGLQTTDQRQHAQYSQNLQFNLTRTYLWFFLPNFIVIHTWTPTDTEEIRRPLSMVHT